MLSFRWHRGEKDGRVKPSIVFHEHPSCAFPDEACNQLFYYTTIRTSVVNVTPACTRIWLLSFSDDNSFVRDL